MFFTKKNFYNGFTFFSYPAYEGSNDAAANQPARREAAIMRGRTILHQSTYINLLHEYINDKGARY